MEEGILAEYITSYVKGTLKVKGYYFHFSSTKVYFTVLNMNFINGATFKYMCLIHFSLYLLMVLGSMHYDKPMPFLFEVSLNVNVLMTLFYGVLYIRQRSVAEKSFIERKSE